MSPVIHGDDRLVIHVIRIREIDLLLALGRDGDGAERGIHLGARRDGGAQAVEIHVDDLEVQAQVIGDELGELEVEALVLAAGSWEPPQPTSASAPAMARVAAVAPNSFFFMRVSFPLRR